MFNELDFYMPVRIYSGEGCLLKNASFFEEMGKKCLIITGKESARKSGALNDTERALQAYGIEYRIFDKIGQNPLLSVCKEAGEEALSHNVDFIIGIGGGSPLDATKVAAVFATNRIEAAKIFDLNFTNKALPFVLVGTTAGTGSEVSRVSIVTVDSDERKKSITHDQLYAAAAFCDPRYTYSLSKDFTVSTGLDAFSHAVEGYFSPKATDISDMFALRSVAMLFAELRNILFKGFDTVRDEQRKNLLYGSIMAGFTLNTCGTSFPHPLGYILTETRDLPHGRACAVFLPAYLERAEIYEKEKMPAFLDSCGEKYLTGVIDVIRRLNKYKVFMREEELHSYEKRIENLKHYDNTPGKFSGELSMALMKRLFSS